MAAMKKLFSDAKCSSTWLIWAKKYSKINNDLSFYISGSSFYMLGSYPCYDCNYIDYDLSNTIEFFFGSNTNVFVLPNPFGQCSKILDLTLSPLVSFCRCCCQVEGEILLPSSPVSTGIL